MNLNHLEIPSDDEQKDLPQNVHSANMSCYFQNLEQELIQKIEQYPIIVGCVAWLTNKNILHALSKKERVSIIIQKEDFLRPDGKSWSGKKLRQMYSKLPPGVFNGCYFTCWGEIIDSLNYNGAWVTNPVRWMGNFNTDKNPAFPRMHNKFLIFCDSQNRNNQCIIYPRSVWTGSFNLTENATQSLENAVYIRDPKIVEAYYYNWQHIFALSEDIPSEYWDKDWEPPFFRIGT